MSQMNNGLAKKDIIWLEWKAELHVPEMSAWELIHTLSSGGVYLLQLHALLYTPRSASKHE